MTSPKRIALLVADDLQEVDSLRKAFANAGHNGVMQVVKTTAEAKKYLRGDEEFTDRTKYPLPCLVILDDGGGWEVVEWMRKEPQYMTMYALILTRAGDGEAKARELGSALESKPQHPAEYEALAARIAEFWLLG